MPIFNHTRQYVMAEVFAPTLNMLQASTRLNLLDRTKATEELKRQLPLPGTRPLEISVELRVDTYPPRLEIREQGRVLDGRVQREVYRYDWGSPIELRYGFASPEHNNGHHYHQANTRGRPLTELNITDPESRPKLLSEFFEWVGGCGVQM